MATVTRYPGTCAFERVETNTYGTLTETTWANVNNLKADNNNDANSVSLGSKSGTVSKPGRIKVTNFGFSFKANAKINSVIAVWEEYLRNPSGGTTGVPTIPYKNILLFNANNGSNTSYKKHSASIPTSRTGRSIGFYLSEYPNMKAANIASSAFGVYWNPARNTASNPGTVYLDYIRVTVDYTDPTYSLAADLTQGKVVGEQVVYTLTLKNTNNCHAGASIPVTLGSLPSGLTLASQTGNGSYSTSTGKWTAVLNSNREAKLTLILNTTTAGNKTITASVDGFGTNISKSTNILAPSYTFPSIEEQIVTQGQDLTYNITVNVNTTVITTANININIPAELSYKSSSGNGTYNEGTGIWAASFTNKTATLTLVLTGTTPGEVTQAITAPTGTTTTVPIVILSASVTTPFYTDYALPEEVLNYLHDGETYTLSAYTYITDTQLSTVYPGLKNHKISIMNGGEFLSTRPKELDTVQRVKTTFIYDAAEPINLRIYGQYVEISPSTSKMEFGGFALFLGKTTDYELPALLFDNPALLLENTDYAEVVISSQRTSTPLIFDSFNWAGHEEDPGLIIKGLKISGDIITPEEIGLTVNISNGNDETVKSLLIPATDTEFNIGGSRDKWGLSKINLKDLVIALSFNNINLGEIGLAAKNLEITIYFQYDKTRGNPGLTVNGGHSRDYDLFIAPGWEKPEGLDLDFKRLKLERTDGELVTSATVGSKSFKIKFNLVAENLEQANTLLMEVTEWLSNKRDTWQRPIYNTLIFDWDTGREYNVVLDGAIDNDFDTGKFECTANFLLPEGVGWKPLKTTGAVDRNEGLIRIEPIIQVLCTGESHIVINDTVSGQFMIINHEFDEGTILTIDASKRTIKDEAGGDYADKIGLTSYWFRIREYYDFSQCSGGIVQKVMYREAV
jgi:hypothetical protein